VLIVNVSHVMRSELNLITEALTLLTGAQTEVYLRKQGLKFQDLDDLLFIILEICLGLCSLVLNSNLVVELGSKFL
jgi:hypothetical protein